MRKFTKPASDNEPSSYWMKPTITIVGKSEIRVDQQYKLLSFTEQEIIIQLQSGSVQIVGAGFMIKMMYINEIIIKGNIAGIHFINDMKGEKK